MTGDERGVVVLVWLAVMVVVPLVVLLGGAD